MDLPPSYRSFLVRLWREPPDGLWRGEVELIQSGKLVSVGSFEECVRVMWRAAGLPAGTEGPSDTEENPYDDERSSPRC